MFKLCGSPVFDAVTGTLGEVGLGPPDLGTDQS